MNDSNFPHILQPAHDLSQYKPDLNLRQPFPLLKQCSKIQSIAIILDHVHVMRGLDFVMQLNTVFWFHHWVEFNFFFDVRHILFSSLDQVYDLACINCGVWGLSLLV
jgi:hypothetical protein